MFHFIKYYLKFLYIIIFFILISCKFQEPYKNHGIVFLKNRSEKLIVDKSNINDALTIIGHPHSTSIDNKYEWIYIERILTKGEYHKLGQNILKANNVLILNFNKYGILKNKKFLDKNDKRAVNFSKSITRNEITQKSFIESFLSSIRSKMYKNK